MAFGWSRATGRAGETFVFAEAGAGPLVVLIHGFPDTPHGYERIADALAGAGRRAVAPWLRGNHPDTFVAGRPYDLVTLGHDVIELLDALGEERAVVIGHDWGAWMAWTAGALHPDRVEAVVPIALPHPNLLPTDLKTRWAARHFLALNMPWATRTVSRNDFAYLDRLYRRWAPHWEGPERDEALAHAKQALGDPRSLAGAIAHYKALSGKQIAELDRSVDVPALTFADTADIELSVFEDSAALFGAGSEAVVLGDGIGHWPHREHEDEFIERLLGFLGGTAQGPAPANERHS